MPKTIRYTVLTLLFATVLFFAVSCSQEYEFIDELKDGGYTFRFSGSDGTVREIVITKDDGSAGTVLNANGISPSFHDLNFDGKNDLMLINPSESGKYECYILTGSGLFSRSTELSELQNPVFDAEAKTVTSYLNEITYTSYENENDLKYIKKQATVVRVWQGLETKIISEYGILYYSETDMYCYYCKKPDEGGILTDDYSSEKWFDRKGLEASGYIWND